jgi:adenylosuccinate lyase
MVLSELTSISPIDGRYRSKCERLDEFFSEFALIRYRVRVEVEYFIALCELPLPQLADVPQSVFPLLRAIYENFVPADAQRIKEIERTTNHDVKAVEYFLKEKFKQLDIEQWKEFIHFGLTSQDINNTAVPMSIADAIVEVYAPAIEGLIGQLEERAAEWRDVSLLAHTHGQPASPTRLGKEIMVYVSRLRTQLGLLQTTPISGKFGGATGNFNAHNVAYPQVDWNTFARNFLTEKLGLVREYPTTQISHYDNMAALFDALRRVNTIIMDLDRDMWMYISMNYFKQRIKAGEVGSSAMPHKVNPIDFENSEGNIGMANAIFAHLSQKLPVSRLQRDLTDSTVLRNIGVPLGHTLIAIASTAKGLDKLLLNEDAIVNDLNHNYAVVAEGIQTILRREGYPNPYETLKQLTRVNTAITAESIAEFIDTLNVSDSVKEELRAITPTNYVGR